MQKSAMKIILGKNYISCRQSHLKLCILSLSERREEPCLQFALKCTKNPRTQTTFLQNKKIHKMGIRNQEKYISNHANTERLKQFSILYMQNLLNEMQRRFSNTAWNNKIKSWNIKFYMNQGLKTCITEINALSLTCSKSQPSHLSPP